MSSTVPCRFAPLPCSLPVPKLCSISKWIVTIMRFTNNKNWEHRTERTKVESRIEILMQLTKVENAGKTYLKLKLKSGTETILSEHFNCIVMWQRGGASEACYIEGECGRYMYTHTQVHRAQVRCGLPRASYASEISEIERAADN